MSFKMYYNKSKIALSIGIKFKKNTERERESKIK